MDDPVSGAASGAAAGGTIGGPWGALAGGILGGISSALLGHSQSPPTVSRADRRFAYSQLAGINTQSGAVDSIIQARRRFEQGLASYQGNALAYGARQVRSIDAGSGNTQAQISGVQGLLGQAFNSMFGQYMQGQLGFSQQEAAARQSDTQNELQLADLINRTILTPSRTAFGSTGKYLPGQPRYNPYGGGRG